jgi:hypothetical protein
VGGIALSRRIETLSLGVRVKAIQWNNREEINGYDANR